MRVQPALARDQGSVLMDKDRVDQTIALNAGDQRGIRLSLGALPRFREDLIVEPLVSVA